MANELWGVGADARRAGRPVVLCAALGVAAFALTFTGALLLGRGLAGSALAALLLPLALSGALAVGLAVAFVVAVALEQPYGARRVGRLVPVVTPLAALVAVFAFAGSPGTPPFAGPAEVLEHPSSPAPRQPTRQVAVPPAVRVPVPVPVPGSGAGGGAPGAPVVVAAPRPVVVLGPVRPVPTVEVPRAKESPDPAEVGPKRSAKRVFAAARRTAFRAAVVYTPGARVAATAAKAAKHAGKPWKHPKPAKPKKHDHR